MIARLLDYLFGCHHPKITRPMTIDGACRVTCLVCGASHPFDAEKWRLAK